MSERIRELLRRVAGAQGGLDRAEQRLGEIRERVPTNSVASLEREVASEIAYSLGKAGGKLEAALAKLSATRGEIERLGADALEAVRRTLIERFNDERIEAERRLRDLVIQREAIGLRRHSDVHQRYVIPPPLHFD